MQNPEGTPPIKGGRPVIKTRQVPISQSQPKQNKLPTSQTTDQNRKGRTREGTPSNDNTKQSRLLPTPEQPTEPTPAHLFQLCDDQPEPPPAAEGQTDIILDLQTTLCIVWHCSCFYAVFGTDKNLFCRQSDWNQMEKIDDNRMQLVSIGRAGESKTVALFNQIIPKWEGRDNNDCQRRIQSFYF